MLIKKIWYHSAPWIKSGNEVQHLKIVVPVLCYGNLQRAEFLLKRETELRAHAVRIIEYKNWMGERGDI